MQRKDIDKIVQDALKNHKPEFSEEFWDEMEQALDAAETPRSNRKPLLVLFSTLLVAITALAVLFMNDSRMMQEQAMQTSKSKKHALAINEKSAEAENQASGNINNNLNFNNKNIEESFAVKPESVGTSASTSADGKSLNASDDLLTENNLLNAKNQSTSASELNTKKQAFTKNARNRYLTKKSTQNLNSSQKNEVLAGENEKGFKNQININENIAEVSDNVADNKLMTLSEIPVVLAETEETDNISAAKENPATDALAANDEALNDDNKKNSLDLVEKEDKLRSGSAANWQSVFYNFRDNPAYTGNEAKYNFTSDTKHFAYEGFGASESRYNFAFDARIEKLRSSIGVYHQRNLRPLSFATNTGISYAYHIKTDPGGEFRIGAGIVQQNRQLYVNSFKYNDQIMPGYGFIFSTNETAVASKTTNYALESGVWYQRAKWMAGFSAKNLYRINANHEVAQPAHFILAGGYNFALGRNLQLMPWAEVHKSDPLYWANTKLILSWKDKLMGGIAYQNINPYVGYGDISLYAGAEIKQRLRVHVALGRSSEWLSAGVKQDILQAGIRYQIR